MKIQVMPEKVFSELEDISGDRRISIGPVKGKYLMDTIISYGIKTVLEIGTNIGYSAILMAKVLPENGRVVTIENNVTCAAQALHNIYKTRYNRKIEIRIGDAKILIPGIGEAFDMVFIDADKSSYLHYLMLSERVLKKDGIVFADNVKLYASEMLDYLDRVRFSGRYDSIYIDAGNDGVEISRKLV